MKGEVAAMNFKHPLITLLLTVLPFTGQAQSQDQRFDLLKLCNIHLDACADEASVGSETWAVMKSVVAIRRQAIPYRQIRDQCWIHEKVYISVTIEEMWLTLNGTKVLPNMAIIRRRAPDCNSEGVKEMDL